MVVVLPAPFGPTSAKMLPDFDLEIQSVNGGAAVRTGATGQSSRWPSLMASPCATDRSCPMTANRRKKVCQRQTCVPGFAPRLFRVFFEDHALYGAARIAGFGDDCADPRTDDEQVALDQGRDDFVRCIRVDFQFLAQRTNGGKRVAGLKLAADGRPRDRVDHLLRYQGTRAERDRERQHRSVLSS